MGLDRKSKSKLVPVNSDRIPVIYNLEREIYRGTDYRQIRPTSASTEDCGSLNPQPIEPQHLPRERLPQRALDYFL